MPLLLDILRRAAAALKVRPWRQRRRYVRASGYESPSFDAALAKVRGRPAWRVFEMACGHDIMVDMPEGLAKILIEWT
jgi:hypothetical protein